MKVRANTLKCLEQCLVFFLHVYVLLILLNFMYLTFISIIKPKDRQKVHQTNIEKILSHTRNNNNDHGRIVVVQTVTIWTLIPVQRSLNDTLLELQGPAADYSLPRENRSSFFFSPQNHRKEYINEQNYLNLKFFISKAFLCAYVKVSIRLFLRHPSVNLPGNACGQKN